MGGTIIFDKIYVHIIKSFFFSIVFFIKLTNKILADMINEWKATIFDLIKEFCLNMK